MTFPFVGVNSGGVIWHRSIEISQSEISHGQVLQKAFSYLCSRCCGLIRVAELRRRRGRAPPLPLIERLVTRAHRVECAETTKVACGAQAAPHLIPSMSMKLHISQNITSESKHIIYSVLRMQLHLGHLPSQYYVSGAQITTAYAGKLIRAFYRDSPPTTSI